VPLPPPQTATWSGIHWRRLAPDDPLSLVRSVLRWRGGFVAVGWLPSGGSTATPLWTSRDGAHWEPVPFNTATTFWPGLSIIGVAEVRTGLVALTAAAGPADCDIAPLCQTISLPVASWTSPDGRTWTPHGSPDLGLPGPGRGAPLLVAGPAGLIAASSGTPVHGATSTDGVTWRTLPDGTFPTGFVLKNLRGTATGYVAGGEMMTSATQGNAATRWSADGRAWLTTRAFPLAVDAEVVLLVAGRDGLIATGGWVATPGGTVWWQSLDGQSWRRLGAYPPLGPTTCPGAGTGCGGQPNGSLVGDGTRMVALRGGADVGVWTSSDGLAWRRLPVAGALPSEQATQAVLLPGGVLLSDGRTTWFGEAQGS
jgi:hypothetical protein